MADQILPLTNAPNQTLSVAVSIDGQVITLNLRVYYNPVAQYWLMDISDQFGAPILESVPLLCGVWPASNILGPFEYLRIGSVYVINLNGSASDWPNSTNLGTDFSVLWADNA